MKKIFLIFLVLAAFISACKKPNGFVISGKITNAEEKYLYLDELKVAASVPIDSVKLKKDGSFEFKGKINYPNFFLLRLTDQNFLTLLVDTTEKITVYGDAANFSHDYIVEGSPGSLLVQELNNRLTATKHKLDSIRSRLVVFRTREGYGTEKTRWEQQLIEIKKSQIQYSTDFVQKHPFSMASVLALYQKFDDSNYVVQDLQSLKVAASALNSVFPKSEHVKALYANTMRLMADEKNSKLREFIKEHGTNSPDINLPDYNGKDILLSSLRGKVVLIQFWSAKDRASRIQNEALTELYSKYKSRGFEIYQVSVDNERSAWIDAIEQDGLNWINVGDMKGSVSALHNYNVQKIPSNYILDKEGNIVARDIQGPELDKLIGKLFR
ncbi:MAG: TlpA disulfide reductase family protein [Bacteroidota bacterium]|nr:TlpA disulfide reductase family protein [Bacteroidota bacterium]